MVPPRVGELVAGTVHHVQETQRLSMKELTVEKKNPLPLEHHTCTFQF